MRRSVGNIRIRNMVAGQSSTTCILVLCAYYGDVPCLPRDYIKSIAEAPHLVDPIELDHARARHIKDRMVPVPEILTALPYPYPIHSTICSCADMASRVIRASESP